MLRVLATFLISAQTTGVQMMKNVGLILSLAGKEHVALLATVGCGCQ